MESLAIIPRSADELEALAERFAKSSLIPAAMRGKVADVFVTIVTGQELGFAPMAALRSIHVIEGKPVLSAEGKVALVLRSGKAKYFTRVEEADSQVTYETWRIGDPKPRRCTWTLEMAKKAALNLKDNWRGYLRQMLSARAKSELADDVYPDVLAGVHILDEIESPDAVQQIDGHAEVLDAEVVSETVAEPAVFARIDETETEDALKALAPDLAALTGHDKERAKQRYRNRLGWIRQNGGRAPVDPQVATDPPIAKSMANVGECAICHEPQLDTSSGVTCSNGHGGASSASESTP